MTNKPPHQRKISPSSPHQPHHHLRNHPHRIRMRQPPHLPAHLPPPPRIEQKPPHRRLSRRRKLRHRTSPAPAQNQVRLRKSPRHVVEKGGYLPASGIRAACSVRRLNRLGKLRPRLVQYPQPWNLLHQALRNPRHHLVEDARPLAPSKH